MRILYPWLFFGMLLYVYVFCHHQIHVQYNYSIFTGAADVSYFLDLSYNVRALDVIRIAALL